MKKVLPGVVLLLLVCNCIMLWRMFNTQDQTADLAPRPYYKVSMQLDMDVAGQNAYARVYIPNQRDGQVIISNTMEADGLGLNQMEQGEDRLAVLTAIKQDGHRSARYTAMIRTSEERFSVDSQLRLPVQLPDALNKYLMSTEMIQSDHPEIHTLAEQIVGDEQKLLTQIRLLYDYVSNTISNSDYENTLDALSVSRWQEAFCGGKSRLLIALLRNRQIPARMCGGLLLEDGVKRKTHVWVEAWLNGTWVPLDPTNHYWLMKPAHYLKLYSGDKALIQRSDDINFQYRFVVDALSGTPDAALANVKQGSLSIWPLLNEVGIDFNVLRIFLLLPVAVLIILLFRNIIGVECFGTFIPALLAVSFRETGIVYGACMLVSVLFAGLAMRFYLDRFKLLNAPRLAILVITVIMLVMVLSTLFIVYGDLRPEHLAVYPIIILVAAIEQVYLTVQERGWQKAVSLSLTTVFVVCVIHVIICLPLVQSLIYLHPELLLAILSAYLLLGRYAGLRLNEFVRFKGVYTGKTAVCAS